MDTRSLSIIQIGNGSSDTNSSSDSALLYYENPIGNVSALLQRIAPSSIAEWVDITSQTSQSLPGGFRNADSAVQFSHTLYESDIGAPFSTPFTSVANFSLKRLGEDVIGDGALFYSSPEATLVSTVYNTTFGTPGTFISGMNL